MTDTEQKALALVNEVRAGWNLHLYDELNRERSLFNEALCRAIERHEAYRQEVSDACNAVWDLDTFGREQVKKFLSRFILPNPDPLVEAMEEASGTNDPVEWANRFYAAIEKRGGKITWGEG